MSIRKRIEAATPGPWEAIGNNWEVTTIYCSSGSGSVAECHHEAPEDDEAAQSNHGNNAEFIAHARTDIPALLEAGDKMKKLAAMAAKGFIDIDALYEAIQDWEDVSA